MFLTGLILGLVGSLHCVGMCGPIALALPLDKSSWAKKLLGTGAYSLGRIITYSTMGAVFGFIGQGIEMAGFQRWFSIIFGIIMILSVFFPFLFKDKKVLDRWLAKLSGGLIRRFKKYFAKRSLYSLLVIGLLNGLLPCGLVYVAIVGAINTNSVIGGALFMALFGLGTSPLLAGVSIAGHLLGPKARKRVNRLIPILVVIMGILFILRGSNLGIKYISPSEKMLVPHEMKMM
jgi:sulfite exporter TauE/SafE